MEFLLRYIGNAIYHTLSVVESFVNLLLSLLCVGSFMPWVDISIPFWSWYSSKVLKKCYLNGLPKDGVEWPKN